MLDRAYDIIIEELSPFFGEQGFKCETGDDGDIYVSDKKAVKIRFDENASMFRMYIAEVGEEGAGEFSEHSTWLFENDSTEKDARCIGADFKDTLEELLGIKAAYNARRSQIDLPSKAAPGATPGVGAFTQRFLTICPQFKDAYKDNVALYGDFLYDDFYRTHAATHLKQLLRENNKKQLAKIFKMLTEMYIEGDSEVGRIIICCILAEAVCDDKTLEERAYEYLEDENYIKNILAATVPLVVKDKKRSASGSSK